MLNVDLIETLEELDPSLRQAFIKVLKVLDKSLGEVVRRDDFLNLSTVVAELAHGQSRMQEALTQLAQAQARMQEELTRLAEAQRRTEERVEELAQAQKRTEERVEELAEAQRRTEQRVEELAEAQKRTEQRVEELAEAQKRTEERVEQLAQAQARMQEELTRLAEAQRRTEERVEELAQAQKRTEERVEELAEAQRRTELRVEELAEAQKRTEETMLRGFKELRDLIAALGSRWGLQTEEVFRETVKNLMDKAGYVVSKGYYGDREVDVIIRDGEHILLEMTSRVKKADVALYNHSAEDYRAQTGIVPRIMLAAIYVPPSVMREILDSPIPIELVTVDQ